MSIRPTIDTTEQMPATANISPNWANISSPASADVTNDSDDAENRDYWKTTIAAPATMLGTKNKKRPVYSSLRAERVIFDRIRKPSW